MVVTNDSDDGAEYDDDFEEMSTSCSLGFVLREVQEPRKLPEQGTEPASPSEAPPQRLPRQAVSEVPQVAPSPPQTSQVPPRTNRPSRRSSHHELQGLAAATEIAGLAELSTLAPVAGRPTVPTVQQRPEGQPSSAPLPPSSARPARAASPAAELCRPVPGSGGGSSGGRQSPSLLVEARGEGPVPALVSGSSSGGRPVRGRVTVSAGEEAEGARSAPGGSVGDRHKGCLPVWLQFDSGVRRQASVDQTQQRQVGMRDMQVSRTPSSPSQCGRARPPRSTDTELEERTGTACTDGGDRKLKRLQQEVQKLTQRLKEAEHFSTEDEGLPSFRLDEVEVGQQIAQGGFASVHHATWRSTPCAIKKIFDPVITPELKADFENEVRMLRRLRHPNIVTLMAVCRTPPSLSFLTEYIDGGSLFEMLHGPAHTGEGPGGGCSNSTLPHVLRQASAALAYMHATDVVHRDVKSHNVLLCGRGKRPPTKLCDFGLARMKSELCSGTMQWAGTAPYMALELFEKRRYTEAVDVFAFGVLLWEVAAADIPHANLEAVDIVERVRNKECAGLTVPRSWPGPLKALLRAALDAKQEERPSMAGVVSQLRGLRDFPNPFDRGC